MTYTRTFAPLFASRASRLLPALAALALGFGGLNAYGDTTSLNLLNALLANFAADKTTPPAVPKVPTLITAKADDVVFAVYQATLNPGYGIDTPAEVAELVRTALEAQ